jgi:hypothetical protein
MAVPAREDVRAVSSHRGAPEGRRRRSGEVSGREAPECAGVGWPTGPHAAVRACVREASRA